MCSQERDAAGSNVYQSHVGGSASDDASSLLGVYSTVEVHGYIVAFCRGFSFRGRTGTDYISHPSGDDEIRPGEKIAVRESLTATTSWFHRRK